MVSLGIVLSCFAEGFFFNGIQLLPCLPSHADHKHMRKSRNLPPVPLQTCHSLWSDVSVV